MTSPGTAEEFWDAFYGEGERWSGRVNPVLEEVAAGLAPGTALDLGCGEGADALWLAGRGWRVTAVDVSARVLARAAARAGGAGDRIDWQRHDLERTFPEGSFDLVSAQFLQSPLPMARERVLRAAAGAVAPGGLLLVVGHHTLPPGAHDHGPEVFPGPQEVLASLDLAPGRWRTDAAEVRERTRTMPDGSEATVGDAVVALTRLA